MALDHYVSQVYLKNFYSTDLGPLMHAVKKSDLKYFTPDSDSVCRIEKGNTNPFLAEERIIEEFLKSIEPNYNRAVDALLEENFRNDVLYTIAGLVAYIQTCSPTGVQISKKHMETMIEDAGKTFDQQGKITPLPEELGGKTFTELLNQGSVNVEVDPKYSQAIGISSIINTLSFFANCHWDIIINEYEDNTFFSSDFPIGFERSKDPLIINKIFPLRPDVAIRIKPHMNINTDKPDFEFPEFRYRVIKPKRKEVVEINRLLVRCAETWFFSINIKIGFFCSLRRIRNIILNLKFMKLQQEVVNINFSLQGLKKIIKKHNNQVHRMQKGVAFFTVAGFSKIAAFS